MNAADALFFSLLALADLLVIVYLRRARMRHLRAVRIMRSLELAVQRENADLQPAPAKRWPPLQRAS